MAYHLPALALFASRTKCFEQTLREVSCAGERFRFAFCFSSHLLSPMILFDIKTEGQFNQPTLIQCQI